LTNSANGDPINTPHLEVYGTILFLRRWMVGIAVTHDVSSYSYVFILIIVLPEPNAELRMKPSPCQQICTFTHAHETYLKTVVGYVE
jgi:hypothetical protein